jgi:predicted ribosomally synthesized peptide with nif11-like leader
MIVCTKAVRKLPARVIYIVRFKEDGMSKETMTKLQERLAVDKEFSAKYAGLTDAAAIVRQAQADGFDLTAEDVAAIGGELPDSLLEGVAGGDVARLPSAFQRSQWDQRFVVY